VNDDQSLWSHLGGLAPDVDALRKYRRTACPVEGDDDVDDFEDDLPVTPPKDDPSTPADDTPDDKKKPA
jgi:hypothetical protein